jgi:tetrahydromethanopterin S-methyltransferase subunit A
LHLAYSLLQANTIQLECESILPNLGKRTRKYFKDNSINTKIQVIDSDGTTLDEEDASENVERNLDHSDKQVSSPGEPLTVEIEANSEEETNAIVSMPVASYPDVVVIIILAKIRYSILCIPHGGIAALNLM